MGALLQPAHGEGEAECRAPWGLPNGVSPDVCLAEVPQYTMIYIRALLYKIDSWTDRAFKGFAVKPVSTEETGPELLNETLPNPLPETCS